jgi:hypothetical protein
MTNQQQQFSNFSMKNLFSVAILAAAFAFTSCGDKSLSARAASAMCNCPVTKDIAALEKEMEVNKDNPEKLLELNSKIVILTSKARECDKDIITEFEKLSGDDKIKFQIEMKEKMQKTCPDLMPKK